MTEREYDFWRGWGKAIEQHGAYYAYHQEGRKDRPDFSDGYVSACQYWNMPVVDQKEAQSV